MVKGLEKFREHFVRYQDHYVLIGGAACEVQMEAAGLDFRATKDLDLVLCVEVLNLSFIEVFWAFILAGGYQQRERSSGNKEFYRFLKPSDPGFPAQLELFSRRLDNLPVAEGSHLTPIPAEGEMNSLSAILLDDGYYGCLQQGAEIITDLRVLKPEYLMVFKAKAYLDLAERLSGGEKIDSRDLKKHQFDVFRLFQLLSPTLRVLIPEAIKVDMRAFVDVMQNTQIDLKVVGINGKTCLEILQNIRVIFELG